MKKFWALSRTGTSLDYSGLELFRVVIKKLGLSPGIMKYTCFQIELVRIHLINADFKIDRALLKARGLV